jgi:hypothetical protein
MNFARRTIIDVRLMHNYLLIYIVQSKLACKGSQEVRRCVWRLASLEVSSDMNFTRYIHSGAGDVTSS